MRAVEASKIRDAALREDSSALVLARIKAAAELGYSAVEVEASLMTPATRKKLRRLGYGGLDASRYPCRAFAQHIYDVTW